MRNRSGKLYRLGAIFGIIFIIFTILVKVVDVQAIGPEGSKVGFATINGAFFEMTGFHEKLYNMTEVVGNLTFIVIALFASIGAYQLFTTLKLSLVDKRIIALGVFYVVVGIFYLMFRVVTINFRPILIEGGLEASYPSSHTMMAFSVFLSAIVMINEMIDKKGVRIGLKIGAIIVLLELTIGRLFSGTHWLTDICAGIILSLSLFFLFWGVIERQKEISGRQKLHR